MTMRHLLIIVVLACLAISPAAAASEKTPPDEAAKFMDSLGRRALAALSDKDASLEVRERNVRELLDGNFDLRKIGRFVLGSAWPKATPEQREEYQGLFAEFVLRTYSRRIGGYTGQAFKIIRAQPMGKRDAVVLTEIARPSGPPLKAGWRIRRGAHGYKILDVIVEGVSMIATQRSEFRSIVRKQGVSGLIEMLRLQTSKVPAQAS